VSAATSSSTSSRPRTALVTGAARGIGKAIADSLSEHQVLVLTPPRQELDLASIQSVQSWISRTPQTINILVNNAGENPVGPLDGITPETWARAMTVNLTAPLLLLQHCARSMRATGWGRIVNISSCYSIATRTGRASYGAAKAGLNSITRSAALEFASDGVLVNSVCPGFVETDLTRANNSPAQIAALAAQVPLGRLAQPAEIARLVAFLTSDDNTYITGQTIVIDGGFLLQ
jgi:NAD(P)-dependent dehydrogenase (short-subunit alcohol dehydrogenase family)